MKRPHLQKLSSDTVTPGHLISCPTLVIDMTFVLFISLVFFSIVKFHVSQVILSSDLQYGLLVAECVPILPVVELFGRSVHLTKQDFLGTNRNAGNYFFVTQIRITCQKHSSNICKHISWGKVTQIELFVAGDKHHFDICNHLLAAEQLQLPTHGAGRTFLLLLIEKCYLFTEETNTKIYNVYYTCQCVSLWNVSILYYTTVTNIVKFILNITNVLTPIYIYIEGVG